MFLNHKWTGGQYSFFRALFGLYLFVHFLHLAPWGAELFSNKGVLTEASASPVIYLFPNILAVLDGPGFVTGMLILGALLALCFGAGFRDRWAAGLLWYIWACLYGRNPFIANPGLPYVGWMLLAHVFMSKAPYGSCDAKGRVDPDGGWQFPKEVFTIAWVLMAVGYSYSGLTKLVSPSWVDGTALARVLDNPLARPGMIHDLVLSTPEILMRLGTWGALAFEVGFVIFALIRKVRPLAWTAMLLMHFSLMMLIDFADLSLGMVMLHLFTFDPGWIKGLKRNGKDKVFYDGECGLCHGAVRFILAEDRNGDCFQLAPLQSQAFIETLTEEKREKLPDSIVLAKRDGNVLVKSNAILYILKSLGGYWRILGSIVSLIPKGIRDVAYDGVARIRKKIFGKTKEVCPMMPPKLRERFLLK